MAKKVKTYKSLLVKPPAPPVGPALGQAGINIMGFTRTSSSTQLTKLV